MQAPVGNISFSDEAVPVKGSVYGGQTPLTHATVNLYSSGTSGYGAGASKLATYYNAADPNGSFSFTKLPTPQAPSSGISDGTTGTWACPPSGDPIIYLLAIGGDPQSGTDVSVLNPVVVQAAAIGPCSTISGLTFVQMNEISSAAFAVAFAPYLSPGTSIGGEMLGTSNTTQGSVGLLNAWNILSNNLLDIPVGYSFGAQTYNGSGTAANVTVTATPESSKIIAMANILASCVNTSNTSSTLSTENVNCQELLTGALPPIRVASTSQPTGTFNTAVDTLQAALYMELNPADTGTVNASYCGSASLNGGTAFTKNIDCLWSLKPKSAPFSGDLATEPTDWTVSVNFTASGTCSNGNAFINGPMSAAIDVSGNIWFTNHAGATSGNANFAEMSPIGVPLVCAGGHTDGQGITIDPTGNVWVAFNGTALSSAIAEWPAGGSAAVSWPALAAPWAIVSDKSGNIFYQSSAAASGIYEFIAPGTTATAFPSTQVVSQFLSSATASPICYSSATDTTGRLWLPPTNGGIYAVYPGTVSSPVNITGYSVTSNVVTFTTTGTSAYTSGTKVNILGLTSGTQFNHQVLTVLASPAPTATSFAASFTTSNTSGTVSDSGTVTAITAYTNALETNSTTHYGVGVSSSGTLLYSGPTSGSATVGVMTIPANGSTATVTNSSAASNGGVTGARGIILDGANNIWVANYAPETGTTSAPGPMAASEQVNTTGTTFIALSPTVVASPTCGSTACAANGGYQKSTLTESYSVSVDPSGNVWYLGTNASGAFGTAWAGTNIVQIVGAAVPVVTPLSVAAATNSLATKP